MLKAVLFDLDGTLLDTIPDIAGALNRSLAALGLPTHPVEQCKSFVGSGIREAIRRAAPEGTWSGFTPSIRRTTPPAARMPPRPTREFGRCWRPWRKRGWRWAF